MVVLLVDPALRLVAARAARLRRSRARPTLDLVARALVRQKPRSDLADDVAVVERPQHAVARHFADDRARQLPARAHLAHGVEHLRANGRDHPLLRLGDHDLPRLHAVLALRHAVEVHVDAGAVRRHLRERRGEPRGPAVLQRLDEPALDELDARLDQLLAGERIADLNARPLVGIVLAELLRREHRRAADAVAPGRGAVEHDELARAARLRACDARARKKPDAHRVDQRVVRVRLVEDRLAADRRHADGVAVRADSCDGAVERVIRRAEAQPVEERDGPRAHGDDVAQDSADAGRGALEGLDCGGMVVRLDLECDRLAVAEIDHARVLARPLQDAVAGRRQALQEQRRVLVAAVLRPEQREDRELEVVRLALEKTPDPLELRVSQPERAVQRLFRDLAQAASLSPASDGTVRRDPQLLVVDQPARRDLGRVVPLHQGRRPRLLASGDDGDPARVRGAPARRLPRRDARLPRGVRRRSRRRLARPRDRRRQRRDPVHADRAGARSTSTRASRRSPTRRCRSST